MAVEENGNTTLHYVYTDHLGSINAVTNAAGVLEAKLDFDAYGRRRNPVDYSYLPNNTALIDNGLNTSSTLPAWLYRGYTGHEMLDEFTLINMNARLYDPVLGLMAGVDNVIQAPNYTQNYSRYNYCFNNPLKYTDPSGNVAIIDDILAAGIGGCMNLWSNWSRIESFGQGAAYFGIGAVGGWGNLYTFGAGGSAFTALGNGLMQHQSFDEIGKNMVISAAVGAASFGIGSAVSSTISPVTSKVVSPVLSNAIGSTITGATTGYTISFASEYGYSKNFSNAHNAGLQGLWFGASIGFTTGAINGLAYSYKHDINPLTGKPKQEPLQRIPSNPATKIPLDELQGKNTSIKK